MSEAEAFAALRSMVQQKLARSSGCHDFDHTLRVMKNAELLLAESPDADALVVRLAALLHDVGRPEEYASRGKVCHAEIGAELAFEEVRKAGYPQEVAEKVRQAVRSHRYRSGVRPATREAEIVFDADKLDSLGAVGIGRAFLFAGHVGARLHNTAQEALAGAAYGPEDTAYREYLVKLNKLPSVLYTEAGKRIASERAAYMRDFFQRMDQEAGF